MKKNVKETLDSTENYEIVRESKRRVISTVIWIGILAFIPIIGWLIAFIISIIWATKYCNEYIKLEQYVKEIKIGKFDVKKLDLQDESLSELALDIESVKNNIKVLVKEEIKSERLKTDLIVSATHDLEMPLSSILDEIDSITVGSNLTQNELNKRLEIIRLRAKRIKMLSNDLIEKSYISNSDMKVNIEKVDMFTTITKGLGEMENDIKKSAMSFKLNIKKQKIYANADPILFWRVIENLLHDIFKHAKRNGRVLFSVDEDDKFVCISLKNELEDNFSMTTEEFNEKYLNLQQGTSSLMVARSLTLLQKGELEVKIEDGIFQVIIKLQRYTENEE